MKKKEKIIVGLSGGVDSAVAAYLLQKQGYAVRAVFMKNFSERVAREYECPWREDRLSAYRVAAFLGIPIVTWNFEREYRDRVLKYLFREYGAGRTPNPDVMCNKEIKFSVFLRRAKAMGIPRIATGHYARIRRSADGVSHLLKANDATKDQSYFLAALNQRQLAAVSFPVGGMTKKQVRALARRIGLPNAERPDSQGICFVGPVTMKAFLKTRIKPKPGDIVTTKGVLIGRHDGVHYYTIGQRRGINLGGGPALYVIGKDMRRNRLIVGTKNQLELFTNTVKLGSWHWVASPHKFPLRCTAKIRYRQRDERVIIRRTDKNGIVAHFSRRQRAVAPGQTFAAYQGSELIGSATIVE